MWKREEKKRIGGLEVNEDSLGAAEKGSATDGMSIDGGE